MALLGRYEGVFIMIGLIVRRRRLARATSEPLGRSEGLLTILMIVRGDSENVLTTLFGRYCDDVFRVLFAGRV